MLSLEENSRPHGNKKLRGSIYYRLRSGDYRIIYAVNEKQHEVKILDIAHRKDVYR